MTAKYKISFFLLGLMGAAIVQVKGQTVHLFNDYIYSYEAIPASARAAAMGWSEVANGGTVAEARINPAGLGLIPQKLQTDFSYGGPVMWDPHSNTSFVGVGYKVNSQLTVGLSRFGYAVKNSLFGPYNSLYNVTYYPPYQSETFYTGTVSYKIIDGLTAGVNLNYFYHHVGGDYNSGAFLGDIGALYERQFTPANNQVILNQTLHIGASYTNINDAKTTWKTPSLANTPLTMTSHLYIGASYSASLNVKDYVYGSSILIPEQSRTVDLLFQAQYTDFLDMRLIDSKPVAHDDQDIRHGEGVGAEILLLKILALRIGYQYELRAGGNKEIDGETDGTYPYNKGLTSGLGLNIPVYRLTGTKVPFDVALDYLHQQPFKWLIPNPYLKELPGSEFELRLDWHLK